jgi:hypothetical protein
VKTAYTALVKSLTVAQSIYTLVTRHRHHLSRYKQRLQAVVAGLQSFMKRTATTAVNKL